MSKKDIVCKCGHPHSKHLKNSSVNFSAGRCTVDKCRCKNFIHNPDYTEWICTDPDNDQWSKRISTYIYEFKEKDHSSIIDLEKYTWKQICDVCESYYPNMDELFELYKSSSTWIIAECIFEIESGMY